MNPHSSISDPRRILAATVEWVADPDDLMWLRSSFEGSEIYLRINYFPDENLYSLWVGEGEFVELEDMPAQWSRVGPLRWPPTARPRGTR